ncbi:trehalase-like domain-containing protein, partial [Streptomyces nigra]
MSAPIEDYALVSDLETAALVGRDGSVDWLCLPRFDSPASLAALLGTRDNGTWRLAPIGAGRCTDRRYRHDTLLLQSRWTTPTGTVRVTDFMPPRTGLPCVVRLVEGVSGTVSLRSELRLRFHQGRVVPWIRAVEGCSVAIAGPDAVWLGTEGPVEWSGADDRTVHDFTVTAGRRVALTLVWSPSHRPGPPAPLAVPAETMLKETADFWRRWTARARRAISARRAGSARSG